MKRFLFVVITAAAMIMGHVFDSGTEPSKYEGKVVKKIEFTGLKNVDPEDLLYMMKTAVNSPLKATDVSHDIKEIFKKGKMESILVEIEEFDDGVRLRLVCKERPIIKQIVFKGYDELSENDLTSTIVLKEGEVYRKDYIEKSLKKLKAKYDSEGLFNAVITYKVEAIKGDESNIKLIFFIDEGEEIKIRKITILGAKKIYPKELIGQMETSEKGLFKDGNFKSDVYETDKNKIVAYYKEQGYLDAQILEDKVEYEWTDPNKKTERCIFITMKIYEGEKYYFDKYSVKINGVEGKTVYTPEQIMEEFELTKRGEVFNNTLFEKDRQMISFNYASKGYIFARVMPNKTITEVEVDVDGKKEKRKYVAVDFTIDEGTKAYIDMIIIKGNKKTKDKVIRRELVVKEGELFDAKKLQVSRELVYNLGFFKQVNVDVRPGSREGYMNLIVDVEEQPTGTISMGGGYGTKSGFSIFADIAENNLFGNGQRVGVRFEYGPERNSLTLSFTERWLFDYPIGFSSSVFYNYYRIKDNPSVFSNSTEKADYHKQGFGYSFSLSYRFWYYYAVGTGWTQEFKRIVNVSGNSTEEVFHLERLGWQQARTLSVFTTRDSRDNYMNPTAGSRSELVVAFTGGRVLGGDDHFIKVDPSATLYYSPFHLPFLKSHPVVFEFRGSASFLLPPFGRNALFRHQPVIGVAPYSAVSNEWLKYEERLRMGGPETLRGWDYDDSRFPSSWKDVGLFHRILYGVELRIPIHPQMLWTALFFDSGSLWSDSFWERQLNTNQMNTVITDLAAKKLRRIDSFFSGATFGYFRYSYGFGFRIQIPMMPLRFWFGRRLIYSGGFKSVGGLNFQFAIGDMRF